MKHLYPYSLFESKSSDRRAFQNWLNQRDISDFDEELFQLFIKHRNKLEDKNIFNYPSKDSLEYSLHKVSKKASVKKFEKDIRLWHKLGLNCDVLYQDENYVVLHANDFESERKLSSGCHICTNFENMYNHYTKLAFLFDILDFKNNERYFGTFTFKDCLGQKAKQYSIVNKKDSTVSRRIKKSGQWEDQCSLQDENIKNIVVITDKIIDDLFFKSKSISESKSTDETLYIFDFDDTIVDSPRFEELAIKYLKEGVTIKSLVDRALNQIGVSKSDIKIEHGRLYVDDPDSKIEVKGSWVRKKGRVYLVAPDRFYYSDISFPDKVTKLAQKYKMVKNKAIVTARLHTVRNLVEKYLDKLELGQPNWGLFMYPSRDEDGSKVAVWKAKTIVKLIKDSGFTKVEYFDDKSKIVNAVAKAVREHLPKIDFKGHKVKSPEMTYLNEELDYFRKFITKYDKSDFISRSDSRKLSSEGIRERDFQKLQQDINKSLGIFNKIDDTDIEYLLRDIDIETKISHDELYEISRKIRVSTKGKGLFDSISDFHVSINHPETYSNRIANITNRILKDIIEKVDSGKDSELSRLLKSKDDYFSEICYYRLKQSKLFENIKITPELIISYMTKTDTFYQKDIDDIKVFCEEMIERLLTISNIKELYRIDVSARYGKVDISIKFDINESLKEELFVESDDRVNLIEEIKDIFIDEIVDVFDIEQLPNDLEDDETPGIFYDFNNYYLSLDLDKPYLEILMWVGDDYHDKFKRMEESINNFIERIRDLGYDCLSNFDISGMTIDEYLDYCLDTTSSEPFEIKIYI